MDWTLRCAPDSFFVSSSIDTASPATRFHPTLPRLHALCVSGSHHGAVDPSATHSVRSVPVSYEYQLVCLPSLSTNACTVAKSPLFCLSKYPVLLLPRRVLLNGVAMSGASSSLHDPHLSIHTTTSQSHEMSDNQLTSVISVGGNAVSAFLSWRLSATNACDVTLVWKNGYDSVAQYGLSFKYVFSYQSYTHTHTSPSDAPI